MTNLIPILNKYIKECIKSKETHTFRGLIGFMKDEGINIGYIDAQCMGLLDFNNLIFELIEETQDVQIEESISTLNTLDCCKNKDCTICGGVGYISPINNLENKEDEM